MIWLKFLYSKNYLKLHLFAAISAIPKIVCETIHALELQNETPSWKIMDNKGRVTVVLHWDQRQQGSGKSEPGTAASSGTATPKKQSSLVIQVPLCWNFEVRFVKIMKPRRTPSSLLGHYLTQPPERERWPLTFSKDVTTSKGCDKFGGDGKPIKKSTKKRNFFCSLI